MTSLLPAQTRLVMRLIVITPPQTVPAEHRLVQGLFAAGLRALHVRKPAAAEAEVQAYLQQIPQQHRDCVVLHASGSFDAAALSSERSLGGIHHPERMRPQTCARQRGLTTSTALHSLQDLGQDFGELDYVLLSPIFDSISKSGCGACQRQLYYPSAEPVRKYSKQAPAACPAGMLQLLIGMTCGLRWPARVTLSWRSEVCSWHPTSQSLGENSFSPLGWL